VSEELKKGFHRQDAKGAKKRKNKLNSCFWPCISVFPWRSWRLGGKKGFYQ
jgi:hypothetical protein